MTTCISSKLTRKKSFGTYGRTATNPSAVKQESINRAGIVAGLGVFLSCKGSASTRARKKRLEAVDIATICPKSMYAHGCLTL